MGTVTKLRTNRDRIREDQAAELREALLPFEASMPGAVRALIAHIDRATASQNGWIFVMLGPAENAAVVRYLRQTSSRPLVAMELWALCLENLRMDTGEVLLSREELAEALEERVENVSRVMSELEKCGAIIRHRERVAGLKGPGVVRYYVNPAIATHLTGKARDEAQARAPAVKAKPKLKLVRGRDSAAPRP